MPKRTPADHARIASAMEALADGADLEAVATSLGITLPALRQWALSKAATDSHPDQVELYHHARIIEMDRALDRASDHAEVSKRSHQAKLARYDAERRLSRLWGLKQEVAVTSSSEPPDLNEVARRMAYVLAQAARRQPALPGTSQRLPSPPAQPDATHPAQPIPPEPCA